MPDQVTITWKDATGTYTNGFTIESPATEDIKRAFPAGLSATPTGPMPPDETPEEFYARLSFQIINQVASQAQGLKQQLAAQQVRPVEITPIAAPVTSSATRVKPT